MKLFKSLMVLMISLMLFGCTAYIPEKQSLDSPRLASTEYLSTKDAKFSFKIIAGKLVSRYELFLWINRKFEQGAFLKIEFENPLDRSKPIERFRKVLPDETKIFIKSPVIKGRRSYVNYDVLITIYTDMTMRTKLGEHKQVVRSLMEEMI